MIHCVECRVMNAPRERFPSHTATENEINTTDTTDRYYFDFDSTAKSNTIRIMGRLEQASTLAQSSCGRQASGNMPGESGTRGIGIWIASEIKCRVPLWTKLYVVGKPAINAFMPSSPRGHGVPGPGGILYKCYFSLCRRLQAS